jgi:hypothetical protein
MQKEITSKNQVAKKSYETPALTVHGSVEQLTQGIAYDPGHNKGGSCPNVYKLAQ